MVLDFVYVCGTSLFKKTPEFRKHVTIHLVALYELILWSQQICFNTMLTLKEDNLYVTVKSHDIG